ncbi:hypothetical protein D1007_01316 [Hordeum vulgare]|nr:hypothetical protein D1007_01316 [Hordeum vulgare]
MREATIRHQGSKGIPLGSCHSLRGCSCGRRHERPWRRRVEERGRRTARGRGRRSATPTPPSSPVLVPAGTHVERTPLEFLVRLQGRIGTRLQLPIAFAKVMSEEKPRCCGFRCTAAATAWSR